MIQLPPLARHGAIRKRTELKARMAGEDRSWPAGRRDLLPESRSADRTMSGGAASHFLNLQDIPETQLEGWNLEGCRMSEARNFRRWACPGSPSSRRGAGRERSAAVVEHRRILGKACRDGRLAARPARQPRGGACRAGDADAVSLRGICSRTMRNVVGP